jgi:two-component system phosphate regulon response regulator PhoB
MKVLVVEDDPRIGQIVANRLQREGMEASIVSDGMLAVPAVRAWQPDLVLLDITLPGRDGLDICRELRRDPLLGRIPIIILSGLGEDLDRIVGLELGADDYIPKPFNDRELALRVKAVIRRAHESAPSHVRQLGVLTIDAPQRRVTLDGQLVSLTAKEFDLLSALADARGRVLTRSHLLRSVWGYEHGEGMHTRTVDVHVRHLRQKLGAEAWRLETVKSVGYRLNPEQA